ncbi:MAG: RDD family protein [Myxococcales bacterium]|nr:RDD family protein [Myxococcales bacterium]
MLLDTTARIETPERIRFRYRLAGPGQRAAAWLVDLALSAFLAMLLAITVASMASVPGLGGVGMGVMLLGLFVLQWLYGVVLETAMSGRTPGKLLLNLRVVRSDGSPARFPDFLLRNLVRFVDFLPMGFGIGVAVMTFDGKLRRLGDLVAGTVVVTEEKSNVLGNVRISPAVTEQERQAMPASVMLSNEELQVIESFLRRRPRLSDDRAEELARFFGPALSDRTGIEAPSWERVLTLAYARATGRDRPASDIALAAEEDAA